MQNAPREHSAILLAFIKLPLVFKTFILSIFEWPLKTGFTVFVFWLSTGSICPAGKYCPQGSAVGIDCPPGTYLDTEGAEMESECLECTQGSYCAGYGNIAVTAQCDQGYYCPAGMNVSNPTQYTCPQGMKQGGSRISGTGVHMYKCVGGRFADFIWFFLNIPWKWNNLVSLRPNCFFLIGYLKMRSGDGGSRGPSELPLEQPLYEGIFRRYSIFFNEYDIWKLIIS